MARSNGSVPKHSRVKVLLRPVTTLVDRVLSWSWVRAARSALFGQTPVLAAGTALFTILAMIPTLAVIVSAYGLIADPHSIESHLAGLDKVMPKAVVTFFAQQLERQIDRSTSELGLTLAGSTVLALYSARSAVAALMASLNQAYRVRDRRSELLKFGITLLFATTTLIGLVLFASIVVALPAIIAVFPIQHDVLDVAHMLRWPLMFIAVLLAQATLFRLVPAPREGKVHIVWRGALVGTSLWLIASWLFALWVERVTDYEVLYGSFATVIVVLLWFYVSVLAILIGGFLNAELERSEGNAPPSASFFG